MIPINSELKEKYNLTQEEVNFLNTLLSEDASDNKYILFLQEINRKNSQNYSLVNNEYKKFKKLKISVNKKIENHKKFLYEPYKEVLNFSKLIDEKISFIEDYFFDVINDLESIIFLQKVEINEQAQTIQEQKELIKDLSKTTGMSVQKINKLLETTNSSESGEEIEKKIKRLKKLWWLLLIPIVGWVIYFILYVKSKKTKQFSTLIQELEEYKYKSGVYRIFNKKNGKNYIGIAENLQKRLTDHFLKFYKKSNSKMLYYAMSQEGPESFGCEILEVIDHSESYYQLRQELRNREKFYIQQYESNNIEKGYNETAGG